MKKSFLLTALFLILLNNVTSFAQGVPILSYAVNANGQVQLEVASSVDKYYVLKIRHLPSGPFVQATSITMGKAGKTIISEPLAAYPIDHYQVLEYSIASPADTDGDGVDDITEFLDMPTKGALNPAAPISFVNGAVTINDRATFKALSYQGDQILIDVHLKELEFVKFYILNVNTNNPKLYFMNTETHRAHGQFASAIGLGGGGPGGVPNSMRGEIVYHPTVLSANGTPGVYRFEFEPNDSYIFEKVQTMHELIAANMPFLKNNFSYYPMPNAALPLYFQEQTKYDDSRIPILFEADIFADIDYLALNLAEGYGLLRVLDINETPGSRDVVLYEALPNEMPRVGGIITSVIQTPLSHVNLRAIQDNLPNAFIRDATLQPDISALIGKYVHYTVAQSQYFIEEATLDEVNQWYDDIRPDSAQTPALNLSYTRILPLDSIYFDMSDGFGAKCANLATMRTFGFPTHTIPDGYGVPWKLNTKSRAMICW